MQPNAISLGVDTETGFQEGELSFEILLYFTLWTLVKELKENNSVLS
jgi:hypothetical protein